MPESPDDPLLGANAYAREDEPAPPRVVRKPTRKERVVLPGGASKSKRTPTRVEIAMPTADEAVPAFRPWHRPPMALLTIYDDGRDHGEIVRIRDDVTVIGRAQGQVAIPHDSRISGRHAEIRRELLDGAWTWTLVDLSSTNGTFVRVHKCSIRSGQELLIGHRRFRFEDTATPAASAETSSARSTVSLMPPMAILVELTSHGDGRRFLLPSAENWIGRDPACTVPLDDPMIADRHVRLSREERGWKLESPEARDGVWFRIEKPVTVVRTCSFQLGEQRFLLRVL